MGTSSSYSGSGTKAGKDLRQRLAEWLDSQGSGAKPGAEPPSTPDSQRPSLPAEALLPAVSLLRPSSSHRGSSSGNGGVGNSGGGDSSKGRRNGGAQRSAHSAANTAGRAAAAAYAFKQATAKRWKS